MAAIALAIYSFTIVKCFFAFLDWYTSEDQTDAVIRTRLDCLIDMINESPLGQIGHRLLERILRRLNEVAPTRPAKALLLGKWVAIAFCGATLITYLSPLWSPAHPGFHLFLDTEFLLTALCQGVLSALTAFFSFSVAWILLYSAVRFPSVLFLAGHVVLDTFIAYVGFSLAVLGLFSGQYLLGSGMGSDLFEGGVWSAVWEGIRDSWRLIGNDPTGTLLLLCSISAAPTLAYVLLSIVVIATHIMPRTARTAISKMLFLFAVNNESIFKQLGNVIGVAVSVATATVKFVTG